MMNYLKRIFTGIFLLFAVAVTAVLVSAIICATCIRTVNYSVALDSVSTPVRIVCISDLHGKQFGRNNTRLINKIQAQDPDVIFLVGDMFDRTASQAEVDRFLSLVTALSQLAPVYFSPGNHEQEYLKTHDELLAQVAQAGATVVNDTYVDVTIAGQPLRIGGTMGHGFPFGRTMEQFAASPEYRFLLAFEATSRPKICLAHMPDTFIFNGAYTLWDVDLVLSGHTHGGLIRIPFVGGLYAPMQGWFPEYDYGYFLLGEQMQMIITSGLAGYGPVPRVNNLPEIAVIDLVPAN